METQIMQDLLGAVSSAPAGEQTGRPYWLARRAAVFQAVAMERRRARLANTPWRRLLIPWGRAWRGVVRLAGQP
jgi:hypothetical protein